MEVQRIMSLTLPLQVTTEEILSIHGVVIKYFQGNDSKKVYIPTRGSEVIESMEYEINGDIFDMGTCDLTKPSIKLTPNFERQLEKASESEYGKCDLDNLNERIESESKALRLKLIKKLVKNRDTIVKKTVYTIQ